MRHSNHPRRVARRQQLAALYMNQGFRDIDASVRAAEDEKKEEILLEQIKEKETVNYALKHQGLPNHPIYTDDPDDGAKWWGETYPNLASKYKGSLKEIELEIKDRMGEYKQWAERHNKKPHTTSYAAEYHFLAQLLYIVQKTQGGDHYVHG